MKKWTEKSAVSLLERAGIEIKKKVIIAKELRGLNTCSAYDYLRNHCGYSGILKGIMGLGRLKQ